MNKKLQTLEEYNTEYLKKVEEQREAWRKTGIACPLCGNELHFSSQFVYLSNPPKKDVKCSNVECLYTGTIRV